MYFLAEIDSSGFIWAVAETGIRKDMVHWESKCPFDVGLLGAFESLDEAKIAWPKKDHGNPILICQYPHTGRQVEALWCHPDDEELAKQRLRHWAGCYGKWPLKVCSL